MLQWMGLQRVGHNGANELNWSIAFQAPLSMGFPTQEYWRGLTFPPPGGVLNPGVKLRSLALQAISCIAGGFFPTEPLREAH